ncbi:MAG: hypothetical protein ABL967_15240 [Bryobacteraceae bacterium]
MGDSNKLGLRMAGTSSRKRTQGGQEIIEFGLSLFLLVPLLLGMFVVGMGMIRSIQVHHVVRDINNIYIHGGDFSSYNYQQLAQRLATGLNLQMPAFGSGVTNSNSNTGSSGDGLIWVTQLLRVGSTSDPQCQGVGAANCTNANKYVFLQRIKFGNSTLTSKRNSFVADPTSTIISNTGSISNPVTDSRAALNTAGQAAVTALFADTSSGQTALGDGQVLYVVEGFFQTPSFNLNPYTVSGIYARYIF